jgi:hypothetical protein
MKRREIRELGVRKLTTEDKDEYEQETPLGVGKRSQCAHWVVVVKPPKQ